jgi:hypothetical protein
MRYTLILFLIATNLLSAPAYNAKRVFTQSNGEEFMARASGNHHLNWIEDENGEILKYNQETKNYEYAVIKNKQLKASGNKYRKNNSKNNNSKKSISKEQRKVQKIQKKELRELMRERKRLKTKQLYR